VWKIILNLFVLPFRPKKSAALYARILEKDGFPLITNTQKVAAALKPLLNPNLELDHVFLLSEPRVGDVLDKWEQENVRTRAEKVLVLPQFPQYSEATTGSVVDTISNAFKKRFLPPFQSFY
jgi:protoheme ferro-lyase